MEDVEVKNIVSEVLEISESIAEKSKELDTLYIGLGKAYFEICKEEMPTRCLKSAQIFYKLFSISTCNYGPFILI
jgi:hypothetical protein